MRVGGERQGAAVFPGYFGIDRALVVGGIDQQYAGPSEGAHAVHVAVSHVTGDVLRVAGQPDGLADAQIAGKAGFELGLADAWVAVGVEQHRLGSDQGTFAVHVDRAAFVAQRGAEAIEPQVIEHASAQAAVQPVLRLVAPGVEAPAQAGQAVLWMADEAWAAVTAPAVVDRQLDQFDVGAAKGAGAVHGRRIDHHFHRFEAGDGGGHTGVILLHIGQAYVPAAFPQRLVMRPDHPGGSVAGPFGRHAPAAVEGQVHSELRSIKDFYQRSPPSRVLVLMLWL
ncbi:hypothetical protein D3C81_1015090 [compost metagenome]